EGSAILNQLSGGEVPATLSFSTGRGFRLLYRMPADCCISNRSVCRESGELRILAGGTFSVMPPSRHPSGLLYRWQRKHCPADIKLGEAAGWVVGARWQSQDQRRQRVKDGQSIPEGQRNSTLFRIGCALRSHGCTTEEILVAIGCINGR